VPGLIDPAQAVTNSKVKVRIEESGPVITRVSIVAEAPGANQLIRSITLYAGSQEVVIENSIDKKSIRTKESVHFGFPFNPSFTQTKLDAGYGSMRYINDQLPGSDFDYLCARRWIDVSNSEKGIQMMLLQSPMVEPAGMIDERKSIEQRHKAWRKEGVATSTWFSYAMNNYWHTNYKADQEGWANFKYVLRLHGLQDETEMEKAGTSFTQPLIAIPVKKELVHCSQLFELSNQHIEVTIIEPQQDGSLLVRLFNPEPTMQQTNIVWRDLKPSHIILNAADKVLGINDTISLAGKAVKEFLLN
jgi:alpha-mannosidase